MNFDKISKSVIEINKGTDNENLLEYYKSLSFKLIFSCESTMYKISEVQKIKSNLSNYNTNYILSDYFQQIFECIKHDGFNSDIDNLIFEIIKLSEDTRDLTILKCFYLVDNFYKYLERDNLKISDYELYKKSLIKVFNEYVMFNTIEIFEVIQDKEFKLDTKFKLSLNDF